MKNFFRSFIICSILISVVLVFSSQTASHEVQKGETLYSISRKYGISVGELCSENNISTSAVIKTGQKLKIPTQISSETKSQPGLGSNPGSVTNLLCDLGPKCLNCSVKN